MPANATSSQSRELNSVNFKISLAPAPALPTIKIVAPTNGQVLDKPISVAVELSSALATGHSLQARLVEKSLAQLPVLPGPSSRSITLEAASNQRLLYRGILDVNQYAAGEYVLLFFDAASSLTKLGSVEVSVAAVPASQIIFLTSPATGTVVKENSLYFSIRTSARAETLNIQLINAENPAISTGDIMIDKTDGTNWQRSVFLDNSFIDGLYKVIISAQLAEPTLATSSPALEAKYSLVLNRQKESLDTKSIVLALDEVKSASPFGQDLGFSGLVNLSALSNIRSGQVYFVWKDSLDKKESLRLAHHNISEEISGNNTRQYKYRTVLDSSALANGNYYLSVELYYNNKLISVTADKLIAIYNVAETKEPLTIDGREVYLQLSQILKTSETSPSLVFYILTNIRPRPEPLRLSLRQQSNNDLGVLDFQPIGQETALALGLAPDQSKTNQHYRGVWAGFSVEKLSPDTSLYVVYADGGETVTAQSNKKRLVFQDGQIVAETDTYPEVVALERSPENRIPGAEGARAKSLAVSLSATCAEVNIQEESSCRAWRAVVEGMLDRRCEQQSIYDPLACEDYLNRTVVDLECQSQGLVDREQCKDYLLEKYAANVHCRLSDQNSCMSILRERYLNRLVMNQKDRAVINDALRPLLGQTLTLEQLHNQLQAKGLNNVRWPLPPTAEIKVLLVPSRSEVALARAEQLISTSVAILVLDSDSDGLPDDLEKYYGTDLKNADSDQDGYSDSTEIRNSYNPLGAGSLEKEHSPLDQVFLAGQILEQPDFSGQKNSVDLALNVVENSETGSINFSGFGPANAWISLYLYSDLALLLNTQADNSGRWQYNVEQELTEGGHHVFVVTSDSSGQIIQQSAPQVFLIKKARAVTAEQYFQSAPTPGPSANFIWYYIIAGSILVLLIVGLIIFLVRRQRVILPGA